MYTHVRLSRPARTHQAPRRVPRPVATVRTIARVRPPAFFRENLPSSVPSSSGAGVQPDPYVDYGRFLTPEGGILIVYKDLDLRLRHTLWRIFAWIAATYLEGRFLLYHSPVQSGWINVAGLLVMAIVNWLIVSKPVEVYRRIEIRPDCIILEGEDIFWRRYMEGGWPTLCPDQEGNQLLCGVYGTRFVEYLTVRRFEELDRMPEVFASHLQDAMRQLWTRPQY